MRRSKATIVWRGGIAALLWATASTAHAEWTVNAGYHNPVVSTWGLNLQYFGSEWAFEAGVGWISGQETKTTDSAHQTTHHLNVNVAGGLDLKFFLSSGGIRPYVQIGAAAGAGGSTGSGAGAGIGGGYGGLGLMLGSPKLYAYGAYNLDSAKDGFAQAGIGIGL